MSVYFCDPKKHKTCRGGASCQVLCFMTTNPEYSTDGRELTEEEVEKFEAHRIALARGKDLTDEDMDDEEESIFPENAFPAMIESIKKIPSESRWIPCSEQYPTTSDEYLITWTCKWNGKLIRHIGIAEYDAEKEEWDTDAYIRNYSTEEGVIAWMPCPEPYKEVDSEQV